MEQYWLGHRERLRQRAQEAGLDALKPHELVELVLFYAVPRADMSELARALVATFGSVEGVFHASEAELMAVPKVTKTIARWIMLTGEMIDAYADIDRETMPRVWRFRDLQDFLVPRWRDVRPPQCRVLFTDYDDRVMTWSFVTDSLHWYDPALIRDMVEEGLAMQARHAYLVLFVGDGPLALEPQDREDILSFSRTLRAIEIELMDCVLVGEEGFYSASSDGGMEIVRRESGDPALHERYREDPQQ